VAVGGTQSRSLRKSKRLMGVELRPKLVNPEGNRGGGRIEGRLVNYSQDRREQKGTREGWGRVTGEELGEPTRGASGLMRKKLKNNNQDSSLLTSEGGRVG